MSNNEQLARRAAAAGLVMVYEVPAAVAAEARRGLRLRLLFGRGGMTPAQARASGMTSGIDRATQLAGRVPLTMHDVKRIAAYFSRHEKDQLSPRFTDMDNPSNGAIAWALWGGYPAREYVRAILRG